jgi:hypothetical protein
MVKPGPFEAQMWLYLEDRDIREVVLHVQGVGVAPEGQAKAVAKPAKSS